MTAARAARRSGAVLLDVLVALVVLGTIGSAAAWKSAEMIRATGRMHAREAEIRAAARLLSAITLWSREDLDRHLGTTRQGAWRLRIDRPDRTLYTIVLRDTASRGVLLETALFRGDLE